MLYKITYLNLSTGKTDVYMNNTAMSSDFADKEIQRLEDQQNHYEKIHFSRTRTDFKKHQIKLQSDTT